MNITNSAISLNVPDEEASAAFLERHLGFEREMQQDGFVALRREGVGFNVIFLRTGLSTFKPASHSGSAGPGLLLVFVVDDIDAEWRLLTAAGAPVATPIETEPWGERYFQIIDPNGVLLQFVQWVS